MRPRRSFKSNRRQAESGFSLFDRDHWGKRIASTAHLGRTLFAFRELDLLAIVSAAAAPNTGSRRALQGVGYVQTGITPSTWSMGSLSTTLNTCCPTPPAKLGATSGGGQTSTFPKSSTRPARSPSPCSSEPSRP